MIIRPPSRTRHLPLRTNPPTRLKPANRSIDNINDIRVSDVERARAPARTERLHAELAATVAYELPLDVEGCSL